MTSRIPTPRRFYLLQRLFGIDRCYFGGIWRAKQEAQPGTPLPDDFPSRAALVAIGYSTAEDLNGAEEEELVKAGLPRSQARAVITRAADL